MTHRAIAFFIHHYVRQVDDGPLSGLGARGTNEYVPVLLRQECDTDAFRTIVTAAGLAAMANAGNSTASWRGEAYKLYSGAIRQLRDDLNDPVRSKLDHTLAAVMLMGTFEVIASGDAGSMKSFGHHTLATALCIELRGETQFRSEMDVSLFVHARRLIVAMPYALQRWSRWAEAVQTVQEFPANRFAEINERLANARAEIKRRAICSPRAIAARLLKFDDELESWRRDLPASWAYKSYRSVAASEKGCSAHDAAAADDDDDDDDDDDFDGQFDVYPDMWVASTWNSYRSVRLLIHEAIITATLKRGTAQEKASLAPSMRVLESMARGVCHSVAYVMGCRRGAGGSLAPEGGSSGAPTPGGYLLLWPLFLAGMLRTTRRARRARIAREVRRIGTTMGIHLAVSMARVLVEHNKSFSDAEVWFIGAVLSMIHALGPPPPAEQHRAWVVVVPSMAASAHGVWAAAGARRQAREHNMAVMRASGAGAVLRAATRRRAAPPRAVMAAAPLRQQVRGVKDDLGGPGGQQPPPERPGGPEAMRRNWVPIGGAALLILGAYAYLSGGRPSKPTGVPAIPPETAAATGNSATGASKEAVAEAADAANAAAGKLAKKLEDQESSALAQLSGRKKSEFGPFRSE
ncbi:hypothetical protein O9K51_08770 [Purpureocillium lavendulum]|uniref:Uncharacterized protein n=1 Tax=Purpureocillium lavendulum TaxID=1247861 RepID=A0AB34FGM2_9HYPO|nr:hypothetical protein O9K51_08770 [Purpureocillium lavendulum]